MHEIDLLLDAEGDEAVRTEWARIDEAGIRSAGRNPDPSNAPHLTLAYADVWSEDVAAALTAVSRDQLPLSIRLGPVARWRTRTGSVIVRTVEDDQLTELHRRVADALGIAPDDDWRAHVTLARQIGSRDAEAALQLMAATDPYEVRAASLRHWDSATRSATLLA